MRIANVNGRLVVVDARVASIVDGGTIGGVDVERASHGRFGPDPQDVYPVWDEFELWAREVDPAASDVTVRADDLGPISPRPAQVFAIGLNYAGHIDEMRREAPPSPVTFTKFPTCLAGPASAVPLPRGSVDWEVELVVVIGRGGREIRGEEAWRSVAGVTVGQDISERELQMSGAPPQFSLAKSYPCFGPIGPALVTVDELEDPDDLAITCAVDGVEVQSARTTMMLFDVPAIIAHLSTVVPLTPGDLIFTGTPKGVGMGMTPPRFLSAGETIESEIGGVGKLRNTVVAR